MQEMVVFKARDKHPRCHFHFPRRIKHTSCGSTNAT
jgi:hypothetical protein